jgi:PTS system nitrogen regulatory IIA component
MTTAILAREEMHSTALENGVALLHPRRPQSSLFDKSFVALAITPSGIPFGGPRGVLTDIFFLIASETETIHLRILARLSRLIAMPDLLDSLRGCDTPAQVLKLLADKENELDRGPNKT